MCGIAGYVDFASGAPKRPLLRAMAEALRRRGPDAQGVLVKGPCGLAHARLSIIDVDGSPQPMAFDDCPISLIYNGETYNYLQLRAELAALGQRYRTQGDTEVVLRWLAREWIGALPRLDAMFAFAAWDESRERLLLARDFLGEKPMFYAEPAPGVLVFGSEVSAVLTHPEVDAGLDEAALRQALRFRAVYSETSLHKGVRELEPGCALEFDRDGLRIRRYFDLAQAVGEARARMPRGEAEMVALGREMFAQSVKERLIADVPVGAFLSGGLDSSAVVAEMRADAAREVRTFAVGFEGDPYSELPYAEAVARALGTLHETVSVGPEVYAARLGELSICRGGPVSQPADVAIAEMSRAAKRRVKVALSGEGADEVFAGYPKHRFAGAPWMLRRALAVLGPERIGALAGRLGVDPRRAGVAARALAQPNELARFAQWFSYLDRSALTELFPGLGWDEAAWRATTAPQAAALARAGAGTPLYRMQAMDMLTWLPSNMLERGDRMTMAEGLELRPPFLDKELAAFGLALPDRLKVRGGVGKWIVRQWAKDRIPEAVLARPKWGFRTPLAGWFRGPLRDMLRDRLLDSGGLAGRYGDAQRITRLLEAHERGEIDAAEALWTLLSACVWYREAYLPQQAVRASRKPALSYG